MLQIGDFSKLTQVSVKTLRYYDDIGLLKPRHIDPHTHYRYYSVDQMPRLNRIIALKEIGFSLDQIARLIDDDLSTEQIKGMFRLRQAEVELAMQEEMARLARIQARLAQIEREGQDSPYEIIVKTVEALPVVSVRRVIPSYTGIGQVFDELFALRPQPVTPLMGIYHDGEFREHDADVEAAVGVAANPTRELEAATMVTTLHQGSYETLSSAYIALMAWIESNACRINGPNREIYLRSISDGCAPEGFITEIQVPIVTS